MGSLSFTRGTRADAKPDDVLACHDFDPSPEQVRRVDAYALSPPDTMGFVRKFLLMQQRDFLTGAIALFTVAGVIAVTSLVIFILESR